MRDQIGLNRLDEAIAWLESAFAFFETLGEQGARAAALRHMAIARHRRARHQDAIDILRRCVETFNELHLASPEA